MGTTRNGRIRYPDARLKGIEEFFELVQNETSWRPDPISRQTFEALGLAKGKETNQLFALKFLGLIDDEGHPTDQFDSLRRDFQPTLEGLVRDAYAKLFETIPTSRAKQQTLVSFFKTQGYSEESAEYQGKLFVRLCERSGIDLPNVEPTFSRARFRGQKK